MGHRPRPRLIPRPETQLEAVVLMEEPPRSPGLLQTIIAGYKEKKLTNIRSSTAEEFERLIPPRRFNLEQALEFIRDDETVEVTPGAFRLRKKILHAGQRSTARKRKAAGKA